MTRSQQNAIDGQSPLPYTSRKLRVRTLHKQGVSGARFPLAPTPTKCMVKTRFPRQVHFAKIDTGVQRTPDVHTVFPELARKVQNSASQYKLLR